MGEAKTVLKPSDYVHLHNHSHYSLLDGLSKVPDMVGRTIDMGMEAIALTDHGTLSGSIEFYKEAKARGINPVLGIETYVASRAHTDKDASKDKVYYHLILLAMNHKGYQNLMQLSTIANLQGFYYKPRIDHELLEKYNEGLIVLSACIGGEIGDSLRQGQYDQAKKTAEWYKSVFGDRYYLELQDHGHPEHPAKWDEQVAVTTETLKLAKELDIPLVVTCDAHYLTHADQEAHEILLCVQTGSFLSDEKRMSLKNFELHITDPKEVIKRWGKDHPEAIANTRAIAERCNVEIELGKILIPKFPVPKGEDEKSYLHKLVWRGLAWRYAGVELEASTKLSIAEARKAIKPEIVVRADYELGIMDSMGFNGYFLIVQDFITWGKDQGIIFGPGRGSAAGSIVAYALRITEIEPLTYSLMFERFLNPSRISMPDIDIDIQDTRRDEVIQYCIGKYGANRVANIVTFGKMAARNAVRDVARVLQVPYSEAVRLAKMIPPPVQGRHILLSKSLVDNAELKAENETNEQSARVFALAVKLEGTIRSHGVHAAGVVIAPDDIVKFAPLEMAQKGVVSTQYSMNPIEELGLLKMDFLGLSNLTIIKNALRIIKRVYKEDIDLSKIPTNDKMTFELLQRADTTGVFQLESSGMKRYLKELKPTLFEDIIAMGALYRPGPMSEIPRFIEGKNHPSSITYLHESLEPILKDTYGVMVYQEQIIKLLQMVAGYTPGEADLVRKAIGKKKREIMEAEEPKFVEGCIKQGLSRTGAQKLWAQIQPFADYSFNKAHATCYAQISYWTAYLKAHFPAAFMAALMTSDYDDIDRLAIEITECKHMGIEVLPPDVNESFVEFAVVPTGDPMHDPIRFGMNAVKNVGTGAVEEILRGRTAGIFNTLEEFFSRVNPRVVNRKALESLVKAGAFDRYGSRNSLLHNIDNCLAFAARIQKESLSGQEDLFGNALEIPEHMKPKINLEKGGIEYTSAEQLKWERELLGLYLSQHPLKAFEVYLEELALPIGDLKPEMDSRLTVIGGAVTDMREIVTKTGQKMAFVKIADMSGEVELVLFPTVYQQTAGIWERDRVLLVRGKVNAKDRVTGELMQDIKILADEAREITHEQAAAYQSTGKRQKVPSVKPSASMAKKAPVESAKNKRVYVRLQNSQDAEMLTALKRIMDEFSGATEVVLVLGENDKKQIIKLPTGLEPSEDAIGQLRTAMGSNQVVIQ
ncbi:MAG: dnaE [Candidatus Saccharibacteria bacterium]|nr:dnaE [Candidatus Saccharibacteria bacterium]